MANRLTGDYDAVVQVSAGTINRVLAALHQNSFTDRQRPSFPHTTSFRIGDDGPVHGHRGWVQGQIGVPRIELINRSTDRFHLEVTVRARYRGDAGSVALPEYINGTVRADYQLVDIDPECFGWRATASENVWVRVVRGSVSFTGTAIDESNSALLQLVASTEDEAATNKRITRLIETLLTTQFVANPHRVGRPFRQSWMRSLVADGSSGVTIPVAGSGSLASLDHLHLNGRDVAVAISAQSIVQRINDELSRQIGYIATIVFGFQWTVGDDDVLGIDLSVDVVKIHIGWNVYLTAAFVDWPTTLIALIAGGPDYVMTLHLAGRADTSDDDYDIEFDATQTLGLYFDAVNQRIIVRTVGDPAVTVHAHGPYRNVIEAIVPGRITPQLAGRFTTQYIDVSGPLQPLAAQLGTLSANSNVSLDAAEFGFDGVVLRGTVSMSARQSPVVSFAITPEKDGFSALTAWIPGGRITHFDWSWAWLDGTTGQTGHDDRWVLRRPPARTDRRFGIATGRSPLPGLDGAGRVCLTVRGVRTSPVTGDLVPVTSTLFCSRFQWWMSLTVEQGARPYVRDVPEQTQDVSFPQLALRDPRLADGASGANTLVVLVGDDLDGRTVESLTGGLQGVKRNDSGLAVLVLFRDGTLDTDRVREATKSLVAMGRKVGAAISVNEDVEGTWSATLGAGQCEAPSWRLVSPRGGITWAHDGCIEHQPLTLALEQCLLPSDAAVLALADPMQGRSAKLMIDEIYDSVFGGLSDFIRSRCPPPPNGRGSDLVGVTFAHATSDASMVEIQRIAADQTTAGGQWAMVVVDGVDQEGATALADRLGVDLPMLADPDGRLSARAGVRIWPTTVRAADPRAEVTVVSEAGPRRPPVDTDVTAS